MIREVVGAHVRRFTRVQGRGAEAEIASDAIWRVGKGQWGWGMGRQYLRWGARAEGGVDSGGGRGHGHGAPKGFRALKGAGRPVRAPTSLRVRFRLSQRGRFSVHQKRVDGGARAGDNACDARESISSAIGPVRAPTSQVTPLPLGASRLRASHT